MSQIKRFHVGEPLAGWPVESWRTVADAVESFKANPAIEPEPTQTGNGNLPQVVNKHTSDLDAAFTILRIDKPVNEPSANADAPYQGMLLEGKAPDAETAAGRNTWGVLQQPSAIDGHADIVLQGVTWVKVDVQSASDTSAAPVDGDTAKLKSGSGGATIVWKETGVGEKWALVLLGGGSSASSVLLRRCSDSKEVVADDSTGTLSANIGKVVSLLESAVLPAACWTIVKSLTCQPDVCPTICSISDDCDSCGQCVLLTPCGAGSPIITMLFCNTIGNVVKLDSGLCYTTSTSSTCEGAVEVTVVATVTDCNSCTVCWKLERCCDNTITKNIYRDGHGIDPNPNGLIVQVGGECWLIRPGTQEPVNKTTGSDPCPVSPSPVSIASLVVVKTLSTLPTQPQHDCTEAGCLYDFTACPGTAGGDLVVRSATDYVTGDPIDLSTIIDDVVRTDGGGCYTVTVSTSPCTTAVDVVIQESFLQCGPGGTSPCDAWSLEECGNPANTICTFNDMSEYAVDDVFKRAEDTTCYKLLGTTSWSGSCVAFTVEEEYEICDDCTTPKYKLVPDCSTCCSSSNPASLITDEDLSAAVGSYIKIERDFSGDMKKHCYRVETTASTDVVTLPAPITYEGPFGDCTECQKECRWVVENVTVTNGVIKQERIRVEFDKVCDEDEADLNSTGACPSP